MTENTADNNGSSRQAPCAFFDDGYTRTGKILVDYDFHPEVNFKYRPMTETQRNQLVIRVGNAKPGESEKGAAAGEKELAKVLASQITEWDLEDRNRQTVEITVDNCLRLDPGLTVKLFDIVAGKSPPIERTEEEKEREDTEEILTDRELEGN